MTKLIARILIAVCLVALGYFLLSLVSAIAQVSMFADRALPGTAVWVFWGLLLFFSGLLLTPLYYFFRLPRPLLPPADDEPDAGKAAFRDKLLERLRRHPARNEYFKDMELASGDAIEPALSRLEQKADEIIKSTANSVFLSTAVMQNGRLDAMLVLACQLRMVWRIAQIFHCSPSPRQMIYLYGSVGSCVLIADNIQDIDFASITTPIVVSIFPSIHGSLPGLQGISALLINSLTNGAANAFLTLRVGLIAKAYCRALPAPKWESVRRDSTVKSLSLVKDIVNQLGKDITERAWNTVSAVPVTVFQGATDAFKGAARKTVEVTGDTAKTVSETLGAGIDVSGMALHGVREAVAKGVKDAVEMSRDTVKDVVLQGVKDAVEMSRETVKDAVFQSVKDAVGKALDALQLKRLFALLSKNKNAHPD